MEIDNAQRLRDWLRECPELARRPFGVDHLAREPGGFALCTLRFHGSTRGFCHDAFLFGSGPRFLGIIRTCSLYFRCLPQVCAHGRQFFLRQLFLTFPQLFRQLFGSQPQFFRRKLQRWR